MNKQELMEVGTIDVRGPVRVVRFQVTVRGDTVITTPDVLKVPLGEGCLLIWELVDAADWTFLGNGIVFKDDVESQFINPYKDRLGKRCMLFDRNRHSGTRVFRYTVALVDSKNERAIIKDPIIENEGDG